MHSQLFLLAVSFLQLSSCAPAGNTVTTTATTATTAALPTATTSTGKRGLSFNNPQLTDYFSLKGQNSKVTWGYNWASQPYYGGSYPANSFNDVLIYSPMLWSNATDLTSIWNANVQSAITKYNADAVLAFNEPDSCAGGSACMTVSSAVTTYKQYVDPFKGKVLLGAPAVTNAVGPNVGIEWIEQFVGNCTGCTIDFIPLHWYGSVLQPNVFKQYVTSFYKKFKKPIWVTEFAPTSGTDAQIIKFLESVMPWMDKTKYVSRYAYFMDGNTGPPYLLYPNNTLTEIGVAYNSYSP